jgi:Steigviridae/Suoliviridae L,D-carboxypeptidase/transpeptidase
VKLELQREMETAMGTTGRLFINGAQFCMTLERPAAYFGDPHPCIPAGEYRVVLYHSLRFARLMPLLEDVPGRTGIEIHWGNFVCDFEGCIGVGSSRSNLQDGSPAIWNTHITFDELFAAIRAAQGEGCTIDIRDAQLPTRQEYPLLAERRESNSTGLQPGGVRSPATRQVRRPA